MAEVSMATICSELGKELAKNLNYKQLQEIKKDYIKKL